LRGKPEELPAPFWLSPDEATKGRMAQYVKLGETDSVERAASMVDWHRNLDCPIYNSCLSTVATRGWRGFSCRKCPMFNVREYHGKEDGLADRASSSPEWLAHVSGLECWGRMDWSPPSALRM
jgi:hypothetical protein